MTDAALLVAVQDSLAVEAALHGDNLWKLAPADRRAIDAEMSRHGKRVAEILADYDRRRRTGSDPAPQD